MKKLLATTAVSLSMVTAASAATFTDLASFQAATTGLSVDTFEDPYSVAASFVRTDFTISETGGANAIGLGSPAAFPGLGVISGTGSAAYDDNGGSLLNFTDFSSSFSAFGVWLTANANASVTVSGSVQAVLQLTANVSQFIGFTEAGGISSVVFDASGGPVVVADDAYTGSIAAVPLPAGAFLLPLGLAALAGFGRRRRKA